MAVINRKSFIDAVLSRMIKAELTELARLIDEHTEPEIRTLDHSASGITTADKGVKHLCIHDALGNNLLGYLIYNDTDCVFIRYNNPDKCGLAILELNLTKSFYTSIDQTLSITELRSALGDLLVGAGGVGSDVTVEEINTNGAAVNSVIVAKNDGKTAEWKTIEAALKATSDDQGKILQNITTGLAWTDVKTINQQSILGSGDIEIAGGSGGTQLYRVVVAITDYNYAQEGETKSVYFSIITTADSVSNVFMLQGIPKLDATFTNGYEITYKLLDILLTSSDTLKIVYLNGTTIASLTLSNLISMGEPNITEL